MTFEEELRALLERRLPYDELETLVVALHRKYDRDVPPPITGTMDFAEPPDSFGG